jgi:hypothetical protein
MLRCSARETGTVPAADSMLCPCSARNTFFYQLLKPHHSFMHALHCYQKSFLSTQGPRNVYKISLVTSHNLEILHFLEESTFFKISIKIYIGTICYWEVRSMWCCLLLRSNSRVPVSDLVNVREKDYKASFSKPDILQKTREKLLFKMPGNWISWREDSVLSNLRAQWKNIFNFVKCYCNIHACTMYESGFNTRLEQENFLFFKTPQFYCRS